MTPLVSLNQCKFQAQRKFVTSGFDVTQMFINKLWFANIVIGMLLTRADYANEKEVPSCDGRGGK